MVLCYNEHLKEERVGKIFLALNYFLYLFLQPKSWVLLNDRQLFIERLWHRPGFKYLCHSVKQWRSFAKLPVMLSYTTWKVELTSQRVLLKIKCSGKKMKCSGYWGSVRHRRYCLGCPHSWSVLSTFDLQVAVQAHLDEAAGEARAVRSLSSQERSRWTSRLLASDWPSIGYYSV